MRSRSLSILAAAALFGLGACASEDHTAGEDPSGGTGGFSTQEAVVPIGAEAVDTAAVVRDPAVDLRETGDPDQPAGIQAVTPDPEPTRP